MAGTHSGSSKGERKNDKILIEKAWEKELKQLQDPLARGRELEAAGYKTVFELSGGNETIRRRVYLHAKAQGWEMEKAARLHAGRVREMVFVRPPVANSKETK